MFCRAANRPGKVLAAAAMAVLLSVPAPIGTCCRVAKAAAPARAACCQKNAQQSGIVSLHALATSCGSHAACNCVCCRTGNQRTAPVNGTHDKGRPDLTPATAAASLPFIPADATAGTASEQIVAFGAAIPHRILHCSWII